MLQRDIVCDCISKQQGDGQGHAEAPNTKYKLTPGLKVQILWNQVKVWAYDSMLAYWWWFSFFLFLTCWSKASMCLVFFRVHWHSRLLHAFKLQQKLDIFWLVFFPDVILKEPVTLSKFGSSCCRQILDFEEVCTSHLRKTWSRINNKWANSIYSKCDVIYTKHKLDIRWGAFLQMDFAGAGSIKGTL